VLLSTAAVVAALGAAVLPARQQAVSHGFSPASAAVGTGVDAEAIAPLGLVRAAPDEVEVEMPCLSGSSFSSSTETVSGLALGARHGGVDIPDLGPGFSLRVEDTAASLYVGSRRIATVATDGGTQCRLGLADGVWLLEAGTERAAVEHPVPRLSELAFRGPAAADATSRAEVTTREIGSSPTPAQLTLVGLTLAAASLALIVLTACGPAQRPRLSWSKLRSAVGAPDVVVVGGLVLFWLLIPASLDDGFVMVRQRAYDGLGGFSQFFEDEAAVLPTAYWLEWLQRFWIGISPQLVIARIPALTAGLGTWVLLRAVGRREHLPGDGGSSWMLAAVYLTGFAAWGMTLRPEPFLAFMVVASLALAYRFVEGDRGWVLAVWSVVIALAVAAHPAGVVAAAPALAVWRHMWRWATTDGAARRLAVTTLLMTVTVFTLAFFLDSDLSLKAEAIESVRGSGHDKGILDEGLRYAFLWEAPYGTTLRRLSVALMAVGAVAMLLRPRRQDWDVARLPGWSLVIGLGLLAATPSKWPWHFGTLVGIASLAVAIEMRRARGWRLPVVVAMLAMSLAAAWSVVTPWTALDLRLGRWWEGAANLSPIDLGSVGVWAVIGIGVLVLRRGFESLRTQSRSTAAEWTGIVGIALAILLTMAALVVDTLRTPGWTLGRQNITALVGGGDCGLGDEVEIPAPGSLRRLGPAVALDGAGADGAAMVAGFPDDGLPAAGGVRPLAPNHRLPLAGIEIVGSWVTTDPAPADAVGSARSDWYPVAGDAVVVMVAGGYAPLGSDPTDGNAVALQWAAATDGVVIESEIEHLDATEHYTDWWLTQAIPPPWADHVRLLIRDGIEEAESGWVAASPPLTVDLRPLSEVADLDIDILVSPALVPYFPCLRAPDLDGAVAAPADVVINEWRVLWETVFAAAASGERYFNVPIATDHPFPNVPIGAHLGDPESFVAVSQGYLTGRPARFTGEAETTSGS
jgi:hypothetical protein